MSRVKDLGRQYPYRVPKHHYNQPAVMDPGEVILPPHQPGDCTATLTHKLRRNIASDRMARFRSVPVGRRAWQVTLTSFHAEEEDFGPGQLVVGFGFDPQRFWVHAKRLARLWVKRDQAIGGQGSGFAVQYRLCRVCHRPLLADQAAEYVRKLRRPVSRWEYRQGPACGVDCKPPERKRRKPA